MYKRQDEASLLAFVDGKTVAAMPAAQDHKRMYDGDLGPNTGGMGTYAPAPVLTEALRERAIREILEPIVAAMREEGIPYTGCLYAGLMLTDDGPKVVEFNARFGDPETQVLLPLLKSDFGRIVKACADGTLTPELVSWHEGAAACVILASAGYPETSHAGDVIFGDVGVPARENPSEASNGTWVFHSGTKREGDAFVTAGGRVLGVTVKADTLEEAVKAAYARVETLRFDGMQYRTDIAAKAFAKK